MSERRGAELGAALPKDSGGGVADEARGDRRLRDTDPVGDQPPKIEVDDEERPARVLTGLPEQLVATVAFAVAILVLWQVFRPLPQGSQYYLVVFLSGTLPLVFIAYRSGVRRLDRGGGRGLSTGYWPP